VLSLQNAEGLLDSLDGVVADAQVPRRGNFELIGMHAYPPVFETVVQRAAENKKIIYLTNLVRFVMVKLIPLGSDSLPYKRADFVGMR
jgi:hypothetical protein